MKNTNGLSLTGKLTYFAILVALVVVMQFLGGSIQIGPISLNFTLIPIIIAGAILGPLFGFLTGLFAGFLILLLYGILGMDAFLTGPMFQVQPLVISLVCLFKTSIAGLVAGFGYKLLSKKNKALGGYFSSAIVPIINTLIFVLGMLIVKDSLLAKGIISSDSSVLSGILVVLVGVNFFFELGTSIVFAPLIVRVLEVVNSRIKRG